MKTIEFAMQLERDGEALYRTLARKADDAGVAAILTSLAEMEREHYEHLLALRNRLPHPTWRDTFRDEVRTLFGRLRQDPDAFPVEGTVLDVYHEARELEQRSHDFYAAKAKRVDEPAERALLERLAADEAAHRDMIDAIVEFLSRPVDGSWLENAEWYHQDTY